MEAPVPAVPSRDTGLPPGVHLAPLGQRFAAFLIDSSVPAVVGIVLGVLVPGMTGGTRAALILIGGALILGWGILVWFMLAVRAASPGMQVMKLQLVGFYDGRPAGLLRIALRTLILRGLGATGIGGLLLLIFLLQHPRRQGWHDLVAKAVVIQKRQLAPRPPGATTAASAGPAAAPVGSAAAPPQIGAGERAGRPRGLGGCAHGAGPARATAGCRPVRSAPTAARPVRSAPAAARPEQPRPAPAPPRTAPPRTTPPRTTPPPAAPHQPVRPTPHSATSAGEYPPDRQPWSGPSSPQSQSSGPSYPQSQPSAPPYVPGPPGVPSQLPTQPPAPPFVPSQPGERAPGPSSPVPSAAPPGIPGPYPGVSPLRECCARRRHGARSGHGRIAPGDGRCARCGIGAAVGDPARRRSSDHDRRSGAAGPQSAAAAGRRGCAADQDRRRDTYGVETSSGARRATRRHGLRDRPRIDQRIHGDHAGRRLDPLPAGSAGTGRTGLDRLHRGPLAGAAARRALSRQ